MAFLYNEEEGCQACGYRKKRRGNFALRCIAGLLVLTAAGIICFLLLSSR